MSYSNLLAGLKLPLLPKSLFGWNNKYDIEYLTDPINKSFSFTIIAHEDIDLSAIYFGSSILKNLSAIKGPSQATLNITNIYKRPVTVDLSDIDVTGFRVLNIAKNVTVIADQADLDSLHFIVGEGTIRASEATVEFDLSGKFVDLGVQTSNGETDTIHGGQEIEGDILFGGSGNNVINGKEKADRIEGGAGNDTLNGGEGNDVIRGGKGVDKMYGGEGDDTFVIVGDLSAGGKIDSPEDTEALGQNLTDLNGIDLNEDEDGEAEVIDGGAGFDTLRIYGSADISNYDITGIETVEIRSYVIFGEEFFEQIGSGGLSITGDGSSVIEIVGGTSADPLVIDLTTIDSAVLGKIGHIILGPNVVLKINDLSQLGDARSLSGEGTIESTAGSLQLSGSYIISPDLTFSNIETTDAMLSNVIHGEYKDLDGNGEIDTIFGSNGNDFIYGTAYDDKINGLNGDDIFSGKDGDDTYIVSGSGKKIILDTNGNDTIDLSGAHGSANLDLIDGGSVGTATIQLGDGSISVIRQAIDLFLLQDISGSFSDDITRLKQIVNSPDGLVESILDIQPDSRFGLGVFDPPSGDHYETYSSLTYDYDAFKTAVNQLSTYNNEELLVALRTVVERAETPEIGYGRQALKILLISTDETYAEDIKIDVNALSDALIAKNIYPVFLVTDNLVSYYENFVNELGIGDAVGMNSDSSDIVSAITNAFADLKYDFIENLIGTEYADILTGNTLNNRLEGNDGDDVLKGLEGDDSIIGGEGNDVAVFRGAESDYTISTIYDSEYGDGIRVQDSQAGRDGTDDVFGVEILRFEEESTDLKIDTPTSIKLYACLTDNANLSSGSGLGSGHAYIGIEVDGNIDYYGKAASGGELLEHLFDRHVPGLIREEDPDVFGIDKPGVEHVDFELNQTQYEDFLHFVDATKGPEYLAQEYYSVRSYNCVDWAQTALAATGLEVTYRDLFLEDTLESIDSFGPSITDYIQDTSSAIIADDSIEINTLKGHFTDHDYIFGHGGNDIIFGYGDSDLLMGKGGNDTLYGGFDEDRLWGGDGLDNLYGGTGDDIFIYSNISDSFSSSMDIIHDFDNNEIIDLRLIDPISTTDGDQLFEFIGESTTRDSVGGIYFYQDSGSTIVEAITDMGTLQIEIIGTHDLASSNFWV